MTTKCKVSQTITINLILHLVIAEFNYKFPETVLKNRKKNMIFFTGVC